MNCTTFSRMNNIKVQSLNGGGHVDPSRLWEWCRVPADELPGHPGIRIPYSQVCDSEEMGQLIAEELAEVIEENNEAGKPTRAIIPCGPKCWYEPFGRVVRQRALSLRNLHVFHMDECLDWQGQLLPLKHPYNFQSFMEKYFYGAIPEDLSVPVDQRFWLTPSTLDAVKRAIAIAPVDITIGGWGQDGHVAYNQARRNAFHRPSLEDIANSTVRIQENNPDTIIALAHRTFGAAYQFVPPMSVTLGMRECLSAKKIRLYSDTGAWKQTALRVALFSDPVPEYPMTLLQLHPDARITATLETARHPISENPDWELL
jgi:glucosamine-6-phosphate deaminase